MSLSVGNCPHCGKQMQIKKIPKPFMHGWVGCPACGVYKQWSHDPEGAIRVMNQCVCLTPEAALAAVETLFVLTPDERMMMAHAFGVSQGAKEKKHARA